MAIPSSALSELEGRQRLVDLELLEQDLHEAIRIGYGHAAGCTSHDPRSLPGTLAWGKGTGHLRDLLKVRGWTADSCSNYETVVHPTNSHAVALAAGTVGTGRRDGFPRTKTPKGPATSQAVTRNAQLSFVGQDPAFGDLPVEDKDRATWLLLHYYDRGREEIRLELSCPDAMSGKQVTGWRERILLMPVPFASDVEIDIHDEDDADINVDVSRRPD
jgi:hypothetical protein